MVKLPVAVLLVLSALGAGTYADNVVQGYQTTDNLQPGMIVTLDSSKSDYVSLARPQDDTNLYGIVVNSSDAPLTISNKNSKVYVATGGTYDVLVSTENGSIRPGDYLTLSSINGVAAKADASQPEVIGQASGSFDGKSGATTQSNGVTIGKIAVSVAVQKNPLANSNKAVPSFLEKLASSIAGKPVPATRIYGALAIFLIATAVSVTLLWSGVKSSLVALGRNPLSRHTIFRGMYKVIITGMAIFTMGLAGVYLLLRI